VATAAGSFDLAQACGAEIAKEIREWWLQRIEIESQHEHPVGGQREYPDLAAKAQEVLLGPREWWWSVLMG
jgi:hypothetical protein